MENTICLTENIPVHVSLSISYIISYYIIILDRLCFPSNKLIKHTWYGHVWATIKVRYTKKQMYQSSCKMFKFNNNRVTSYRFSKLCSKKLNKWEIIYI